MYLKLLLFAIGLAAGWTICGWYQDAGMLHAINVQHTQAVKQQKKDVTADSKLSHNLTTVQAQVPKAIVRIQRVNIEIPPTPDSCKLFDPLTDAWLLEYDAPANPPETR